MSDEKSKVSDTENAIRTMAKVSLFEGKLNDIQLLNIKQYPFIFFDGIGEVKVDYDLTAGKPEVTFEQDVKNFELKYNIKTPRNTTKISYYLTVSGNEETVMKQLDYRFKALQQAIDNLLWKGIKIQVYFNKKLVYESKNA